MGTGSTYERSEARAAPNGNVSETDVTIPPAWVEPFRKAVALQMGRAEIVQESFKPAVSHMARRLLLCQNTYVPVPDGMISSTFRHVIIPKS